ncbi:MAG TPA: response regulator transcription factor [Pedobacter sp.]|nr:response regulator transcription factor [Pedobacter sp.]
MNNKITIAIVDDHTLFRSGLVSLMEKFDEVDVIFAAKNGIDFQDKIKKHGQVAVVLMDISMPIMDGYATTQWIKSNYPDMRVLALSMFEDEKAITEIVRCGAGGYLLKESKPSDLLHAIQIIHKKGFFISELVSGRLIASLRNNEPTKPNLTEKEQLFLQLCAEQLTYKEISTKMNIGHRTVENYRKSLFKKLDVKSRIRLIVDGFGHGLIKYNVHVK